MPINLDENGKEFGEMSETFDFVIVGAVIAARASEGPSCGVALIEVGAHDFGRQ